ncbi:MAG TPA: PQQ-dependent sugar dehydrogenase [Polyangiaceae bacterium]|nr:PQQ-dependent sugar dehydrogenase [Polyangiaceae bacterium]
MRAKFLRLVSPVACFVAAATLAAVPARAATLEGAAATDFDVMTIIDGLSQPTDVAVLPDGRLVISQRLGDIAIGIPGGGQADEHIDVNTDGDVFGEQGVMGVVADPNFATNHYLYFFVSMDPDLQNKHKIVRYVLSDANALESPMVIVEDGLIGTNNHNGGGLIVDENYLYISLGDTGNNATPPNNKFGTCLNKASGKILRVNLADGMAPADNPLADDATVTGCSNWDQPLELVAPDTRVFAWGLRNPFRFWVDPTTKKLWIGDVGEMAVDEISVGDGGTHFGWPFFEGSVEYDQSFKPENACMGVTPATACTLPVHEFSHMNGRNAVIGGLILDICGFPEAWKSRYLFGDHGPNPNENPNAFTLDVNAGRDGVVANSEAPFGRFAGVVGFRVGPDNALYVVEEQGGSVQRVTPKVATGENCDAPPVGGSGGTGGAGGSAGVGGDTVVGTGGSAAGAGGIAGMASGGAAGTSAGATAGSVSNPGTPTATSAEDGGCGCRVSRASGVPAGMVLFAGALGLLWSRRRRARFS